MDFVLLQFHLLVFDSSREGGDTGLLITLVPKVKLLSYLICWLKIFR